MSCDDDECWCCHDDYYVAAYDPNNVWHGPNTQHQQFMADSYNALLEHALQPMLFFDRIVNKEDV